MSSRRYNISLENLTNFEGAPAPHARLQFESNHDEIISVAGRLREHVGLDSEEAKALSVSLTLLNEILKELPDNLLLDDLRGQLENVMATMQQPEEISQVGNLAVPLSSAYSVLGNLNWSAPYLGGMKRERRVNA